MNDKEFTTPLAQTRLTADVVVFSFVKNELNVLVIERPSAPFKGQLSLPGGFVWENETAKQTAERTLLSKAGVKGVFLEQLFSFDAMKRDPRGRTVSISYYALVPADKLIMEAGPETENPKLIPVHEATGLAFDHDEIVQRAVNRLRNKVTYSNAMYSLLPEAFTFYQLHQAYEAVLGVKLDKRNFRKKFLSLGILETTKTKTVGDRHRPAELYRFSSQEFVELSRWL